MYNISSKLTLGKQVRNIYIGFDCGWTGGGGVFHDTTLLKCFQFKVSTQYRMIDGEDIYQQIKTVLREDDIVHGLIEKQHVKNNESGSFTHAMNVGVILNTLARFPIAKIEDIAPITWQKHFNVYKASKKRIALKAIERGFPKEKAYGVRGGLLHGLTDMYLLTLCHIKTVIMSKKRKLNKK